MKDYLLPIVAFIIALVLFFLVAMQMYNTGYNNGYLDAYVELKLKSHERSPNEAVQSQPSLANLK